MSISGCDAIPVLWRQPTKEEIKMKKLFAAFLAAFAMLFAPFTTAAPVVSYGALGGAGTYYGSGNPNTDWTSGADNGTVLSLSVKDRFTGATILATAPVLPGDLYTYHVTPGLCLLCSGSQKATWNYQFSVNSGLTTIPNSGITFRLSVDHNPSAVTAFTSVNAETYWSDNSIAPSPFHGFQNSQNVKFANTPGGAFNVNTPGLYTFKLEEFLNGDFLLNSVAINVQVDQPQGQPPINRVPEPGSGSLALLALLGAGYITTRTRKDL